MEKYGFIYITTNTINGKQYIGQSSYKRGERINTNYLGSGKYLKKAIELYGSEKFTREVIFVSFSFDDLNWAERHFIEEYDAVNSTQFYNVSPGGRASLGFTGKKHSKERNDRLSEKLKGHSVTDKVRETTRQTGKKLTGSKNGRAQNINIYDDVGHLKFSCHGNFEKTCEENKLPFKPLKMSYLNDGKPIFINTTRNLKDKSMIVYKGWFAKINSEQKFQ